MTVFLLICRVVLATVFLVSAIAKLRDRAGSREAVKAFGVPAALAPVVAEGLPFVELACAVLLLTTDPGATVGAVASALLLSAFTVAIAVNLLQGRKPDCHCFGQLDSGETSWRSVGRNVVLIALAVLPLTHEREFPGDTLAGYSSEQLAVGLILAALTLAVGALTFFCKTLLQQYGSLLLRLEAIEGPARVAPEFELPDLDGNLVSLDAVLAEGRPVLVAFISPTCEMCSELVPDLAGWQAADDPIGLLVLSTGNVEANREKVGEHDLNVLLQEDWEVAKAYASDGTPCAFLVGVDGVIAGPPAYGVEEVRQLRRTTLSAMRGETLPMHQIGHRPTGAGDVIPDITMETEDHEHLPLTVLAEQETVLLFWRTTCGYCAGIVEEVAALEGQVQVMLVTGSDVDEIRGSGLSSPMLRDRDDRLNALLEVPGTPAAVRMRGNTLVSNVAVGGPEVLALLGRNEPARSA